MDQRRSDKPSSQDGHPPGAGTSCSLSMNQPPEGRHSCRPAPWPAATRKSPLQGSWPRCASNVGDRDSPPPPSLLLAGPTAVGKSALALLLAERLHGEIISVDSMQVYRGLDIGTAKPSTEERRRVPHHLIDLLDLTESFDAAQFLRHAAAAVAAIQSRGRVPILCGGTGLYFKAFLEGLGLAPPADPAMRAELEATPLPTLLRELEQRDAVTYGKIDRRNPRRVVRALEVIRLTGQSFSAQRADWDRSPSPIAHRPARFFCLTRSADDLRARIETRVDEMFRHGLVAETEHLLTRGLAQNKTALQAIGYRQVVEHLHGERPLRETIELVKTRTRQFAKRQLTWFRHQAAAEWTHLEPAQDLEEVAARLAAEWESARSPASERQ